MTASTTASSVATLLFAAACVLAACPASADEASDLCFADSIEGQVLRDHGKLTKAAPHLEQCAQPQCEEAMRTRCAQWLSDVRKEVPVVAVRVVDDRGEAVPGAVVRLDGTVVDASATFPLDPGRHELRAAFAGRDAIVTFDTRPGSQEVQAVVDLRKKVFERPISTPAYVAGGVALAGLIAFGALGAASLVEVGHLSSCTPYCEASSRPPLVATQDTADVALGVGVAGALAATILYLARPTVAKEIRIGAGGVSWAF
jgi:hypothetical protein